MSKSKPVRFNIQRGASVAEFGRFLADLDGAYLALRSLPTHFGIRRLRRGMPFLIDYIGMDFLAAYDQRWPEPAGTDIYPDDQLEIARISIQSPGWVELIGSLNPLQQIREYLKDRHERMKDRTWRSEADKDKAHLENEILRIQAERDKVGMIGEFYELLGRMDITPEERQRIIWERLGPPMMRLAHHQDTGLLGSQNDNIDGQEK